jgi:hypothetical protein
LVILRQGAHTGPRDVIEDWRGNALVLRLKAFGCSRGGVRSGWAAFYWRRIRGVVAGIP